MREPLRAEFQISVARSTAHQGSEQTPELEFVPSPTFLLLLCEKGEIDIRLHVVPPKSPPFSTIRKSLMPASINQAAAFDERPAQSRFPTSYERDVALEPTHSIPFYPRLGPRSRP